MAQGKRPKIANEHQSGKEPKILSNPGAYKDVNVSWQINKFDKDGNWGLNELLPKPRFKLTTEVSNSLIAAHDDLNNTILKLDGRTFANKVEFLIRLLRGCNGRITVDEQISIFNSLTERTIFWSDIFSKLKDYESITWNELDSESYSGRGGRKSKHHFVEIEKLSQSALKRLRTLKLDDLDLLYSLRLNSLIRVWGIRKFGYLQILWIDLEHEVCPSLKE